MQAPDPIETILGRLMPPALSERRQADIEEMLAELAGPASKEITTISSGKWLARSLIGGGIAAAIGAMCAIFPMFRNTASVTPAGFVILSETDRIQSVTDEGWREDSEGSPMHSVRLKSVQENKVRDERSGMVVQICEPREELLMVPAGSVAGARDFKRPLAGAMVGTASVPAETNGPIRVVNVAEKKASFVFPAEGEAAVTREGGIYQLRICGSQGEVIFEGKLPQDGTLQSLPEIWRDKVQVLCRTLDQALDGGMIPTRQPQGRTVPPSSNKP